MGTSDIRAVTYAGSYPVTKSDTAADPNGGFAAFVSDGGGVVKFTATDGSVDTITALAGVIYTIGIRNIWSSTTVAIGIHGLKASGGVLP